MKHIARTSSEQPKDEGNAPPALVSVCIVTFNQERYLRQCLESVISQQTGNILEVVIGDDCSDDGTSEIAHEYAMAHPQWIRHLRHPKRLGASVNIQATLRQSRGQYIAHLDGDDYWLPGKLQAQTDFLDRHSECLAVYTNAIAINEDGQIIGVFNDAGDSFHDLASMFRRGNFLNTSSMLYRAELKHAFEEIDRPFVDYRMHLMLAQKGLLGHLGRPMVAYRVNSPGAMTATSGDLVRELYWEAMNSVPPALLSASDRAQGVADFLRRVFAATRRQRRWQPMFTWVPRVFAASPCGRFRTCLLVLGSIARIARAELSDRLRFPRNRTKSRVLYRR